MNDDENLPIKSEETEHDLSLDNLKIHDIPPVLKNLRLATPEQLLGQNDVKECLSNFVNYLGISKRVGSSHTISQYKHNVKQYIIWCNDYNFNIGTVVNTLKLRDIVIRYNRALDIAYPQPNSVALKMNSVKKFFEYLDFNTLKLNLKQAFSPDWTTTSDSNAFKRQVRINEEVFFAIKDVVEESGIENDRWIFYFLAWGCRRSEIALVKTSDIDFLNKRIKIYQQKTGNTKEIPLPDWCTSKEQVPDTPYLINNYCKRLKAVRGIKPVATQFIYQRIHKWVAKTAFIDVNVTPHSFRRYCVGRLKHMGESDSNIMEITGHTSPQMVYRYGWDVKPDKNPIITDKKIDY